MSWLAQVSPSSPVSVGMFPSIRTLEVGVLQMDVVSRFIVTSEQPPTADDPLAANTPSVEKLKEVGITGKIVSNTKCSQQSVYSYLVTVLKSLSLATQLILTAPPF